MAPKKRTYSNVSDSGNETADNSSTLAQGPSFAAPATPLAAPRPAPTLQTTTPTRPVALPSLTKSQQKRMGMTSFGSESGGPTPRGSGYGYEPRMPTDAYPEFLNPAQREEVERQREAESMASLSILANVPRQSGDPSTRSLYAQASTPTRPQETSSTRHPPGSQVPSSRQYSNIFQSQPPAIGQYGYTPLPRPGVGDPSSAAGLAALANIPGDPAYYPPAVPSIWDGEYWTGNAATGARDDPFTSANTTSSNGPDTARPQQQTGVPGSLDNPQPALQQPCHSQSHQQGRRLPRVQREGHGDAGFSGAAIARVGNVPQHLLPSSNQHDGFDSSFAPTSRTGSVSDLQLSTEPHVPSHLNQEFDWRVSPNPELEDVVARLSTAVSAHDAHARLGGHQTQAQQGPEMTQTDDSADRQAQQAPAFGPINTGAAPSGHGDMSDVGAATRAEEALSG